MLFFGRFNPECGPVNDAQHNQHCYHKQIAWIALLDVTVEASLSHSGGRMATLSPLLQHVSDQDVDRSTHATCLQ